MKDWYLVRADSIEKPSVLDLTSSETTVYERRNIQQVVFHDDMSDTDITEWQYEQREYTRAEWDIASAPYMKTLMQSISSLEVSVAELLIKEGVADV